jgi:nickel transport protein
VAHNLVMEAYPVGSNIEGSAYFSDGTLIKAGTIEILDKDNRKIGDVKTDDQGNFAYTPVQAAEMRLHLDAGAGHVANVTITAAEIAAAIAAAGGAVAPATPGPADIPAAVSVAGAPAAPAAGNTDQAAIDQLIAGELAPMAAALDNYMSRNSFLNLLASFGILAGAAGIVLFILGARKAGMTVRRALPLQPNAAGVDQRRAWMA